MAVGESYTWFIESTDVRDLGEIISMICQDMKGNTKSNTVFGNCFVSLQVLHDLN